ALLEAEPLPLSALPELDQIVRKTLAKDRDRRYQKATELQSDLKDLIRQTESQYQKSLVCPMCSRESLASLGFCVNCGAALKKSCPGCRGLVPVTNDFCGLCGFQFHSSQETKTQRINSGTTGAALGGERRRATIVYSTVSGCSAILEQFGPDEADREITNIREAITSV